MTLTTQFAIEFFELPNDNPFNVIFLETMIGDLRCDALFVYNTHLIIIGDGKLTILRDLLLHSFKQHQYDQFLTAHYKGLPDVHSDLVNLIIFEPRVELDLSDPNMCEILEAIKVHW